MPKIPPINAGSRVPISFRQVAKQTQRVIRPQAHSVSKLSLTTPPHDTYSSKTKAFIAASTTLAAAIVVHDLKTLSDDLKQQQALMQRLRKNVRTEGLLGFHGGKLKDGKPVGSQLFLADPCEPELAMRYAARSEDGQIYAVYATAQLATIREFRVISLDGITIETAPHIPHPQVVVKDTCTMVTKDAFDKLEIIPVCQAYRPQTRLLIFGQALLRLFR